jgi:hypothetical protein
VFTRKFVTEAAERAVKSAAQAALLVLGADQLNVINVAWSEVAGFSAGGAVLSVLTSIVSANIGPADSPSVVD